MVVGAQIYNILKILSCTLEIVSLMLYELCHNKKIAKKHKNQLARSQGTLSKIAA